MSELKAATCPGCGAPLELTPDHHCRFCRAFIESDPGPRDAPDAEPARDTAEADELARRQMEQWTLGPSGPPINWDGGPGARGTPVAGLLAAGQGATDQPAAQELADDPQLDQEFCEVVRRVFKNRELVGLCRTVEAFAVCPDSDPAWAASARSALDALKGDGAHWVNDTREGRRFRPFPVHLAAWVESKMEASGAQPAHHHWRH